MDPRRQFYLEVFGGASIRLFFVGLDIYGVNLSI
jgi:hypothetical protein